MRNLVVCLILAVATPCLTGCKTDAAATHAVAQQALDAPQPASMPADSRPLLVCFGDSLTAGYGADEGASYPDFLQKYLDQLGYQYHVVNEGISGNTTKDGVDRLPGVIAMKPQIVVLEFGGNDGLRGLKIETSKTNLATMIDGLKSSGAKVALAGITLPPDYGPDYVKTFTANYPALAKQYSVPLLPFLLRNVYGVPGMMQADRTHATAKGNEIVARNVLGLVKPMLKK
ncbi:arylesterase [Granulicella sp. WH15]|uniref:arylesterase n=1 Tax=Granulicella sp. WH15 TaxID=2602070 RepID=UPI00136797B1|nr:arylesterase [Granulicella sp. WH15]QHN03380.1 arylesterase [Granulicella sp. WH15]